jgi:hypothetical protein
MTTTTRSIYEEFADFITSNPSLQQLADYRLSDHLDKRISDLLDANSNGRLTAEQQEELDEFRQVYHLMQIVKLRAMEKLEQQ